MRRSLAVWSSLLFAAAAFAVMPVMPRFPALSPDGSQIVFSWQGDLWLGPSAGGTARRLTANPGYDARAIWAGNNALLFSSDREGSDDVFRLELATGRVERLTFHESADVPQGTIGDDAIFCARRHEAFDRMLAIYRVPLERGTERLVGRVLALEAVPSPDGRLLALVRGGSPAERRHYRGSANRELWLYEVATGRMERLTVTPYDEDAVSWAGNGALVYRSDGGGADRNLYRLDLASKRTSKLTNHEGDDVRAARTSADGRLVAYELWDAIWVVPTDGSGTPRRVDFDVPADALEGPTQRETVRGDAEEVAVSPDGTQVALVIKGDVFVVARRAKEQNSVAEPPTVRVTSTTAREREVAWSPDGKRLVYASDRDGMLALYSAAPGGRDDGKFFRATSFVEKRLTSGPLDARQPAYSPDGSRIAFLHGRGGLAVIDSDGGNQRVLLEHWGQTTFSWSPDSRWLAFSREDESFNDEVYIVPAEGGEAVNVSQHPLDDSRPVWSGDGRRLYWLSRRHEGSTDLWGIYLRKADAERSASEWLDVFDDDAAKKAGKEGGERQSAEDGKEKAGPKGSTTSEGKDSPKEKAPKPVIIDFDRIDERARALTALPGNEGELAVAPDGRTVVFVASTDEERDLYKVRWDGKELARLTTGGTAPSQLSFSKDGKTVFYRTGRGTIGSVSLEGKSGDPAPFAARVEIDRAAMRVQVFDEAWRELDRRFADPEFHGHDWNALKAKYRPLALAASARRDYDDAVNLMLGEVNASHMGFRPPRGAEAGRTGELGIEVAPAPDGKGVVIEEVLPGMPAARVDAGLVKGDRIVAIDGKTLGPRDNFFGLLTESVGRRIAMRVIGAKGEREVVITPTLTDRGGQARYQQWTRERRALVDKWSGGKLGYIHIQAMNQSSLEEFERLLYAAAHGRWGLVIDVRNNGGGSTTDYLMAILQVKRHAWTVPRGGDPSIKAYPDAERLPLPVWTRPAVALCDEASYSNAEIFSWAFKTTKRGSLVGMPTFGAVMSTGAAQLTDGSTVRLPGRRWYVAGSGIDQENNGCPPDYLVEQPPLQDMAWDADAQLAKAVEVMLLQLPRDAKELPW